MSETCSADRKATPVFAGCLAYFPDAIREVAKLSRIGNDKHNPGEPLHWSKDKSADHADCLVRHLMDAGKIDPDTGLSHTAAVAWRALALLQTEIEGRAGVKPAAPLERPRRTENGRLRVYIAGPISKGDLAHNINQATAAFVELTKAGFAPFCPHWSAFSGPLSVFPSGSDPDHVWCRAGATPNELKHGDWLAVDLEWVATADAVLRLPGESKGADQEVTEANRLGIPVFASVESVRIWAGPVEPQE
jgi:hypothetical protein